MQESGLDCVSNGKKVGKDGPEKELAEQDNICFLEHILNKEEVVIIQLFHLIGLWKYFYNKH